MAAISRVIPRYVLAKYVADLSRMEPRNIGVFLWANGEIAARFLPAGDADFIGDKETYEWWLSKWNGVIIDEVIVPVRGTPIAKTDPKCLNALLTQQEDNYLLVDAGELLEPIGKRELSDAVSFLYGDLVALSPTERPESKRRTSEGLNANCQQVFASTGIASRPDYRENHPVECPVYTVKKHLKFNHFLGNGKPDALFQQANVRSQQSVNSTALMLHAVTETATVPKHRCAALARKADINSDAAEEGVALLQAVCRLIFVDSRDAGEEIREVALNGDNRVATT